MKNTPLLVLLLSLGASATACGDGSDRFGTMDAGPEAQAEASPGETETSNKTEDTNGEGGLSGDASAPPDGATSVFKIWSPSFEHDGDLPDQYTCEGKEFGDGYSPELAWSGAPARTVTYAIVFKDLSLVDGPIPQRAYHWAAWNIPASLAGIPEQLSAGQFPLELEGGEQFRGGPPHDNEFFGPCPSLDNLCEGAPRLTDVYSFTLYAFAEELTVPAAIEGNYVQQLDGYFEQLAIAMTEVNATSDARPSSAPLFCPDIGDAGADASTATDASAGDGSAAADASTATDASTSADASTATDASAGDGSAAADGSAATDASSRNRRNRRDRRTRR